LFRTLPNLRIVVLDMSNIDFVNREKDYRAVLQLLDEEHDFGMKVINRLAT
jgi:hypothetical protein